MSKKKKFKNATKEIIHNQNKGIFLVMGNVSLCCLYILVGLHISTNTPEVLILGIVPLLIYILSMYGFFKGA